MDRSEDRYTKINRSSALLYKLCNALKSKELTDERFELSKEVCKEMLLMIPFDGDGIIVVLKFGSSMSPNSLAMVVLVSQGDSSRDCGEDADVACGFFIIVLHFWNTLQTTHSSCQ
nr:uncharacterized protein LOC103950649 [Ipomoea batatas]